MSFPGSRAEPLPDGRGSVSATSRMQPLAEPRPSGSGSRRSVGSHYLALLLATAAVAQVPPESYRVENIATPKGIAPEIGAITFTPDGLLAAAFRRGYIYLMNPATQRWSKFAHGLQTPLGMIPGGRGEFFVVHLPELTRVADTNDDGVADLYETVSDAWGMAGNYHEFTYGPVRDAQGNFYIALGSSSNGGEPRPPVRGELHNAKGVPRNRSNQAP